MPNRIALRAFAIASIAVATLGGATSATATDSRFCGVEDFRTFHYTTTNPHYDEWKFVIHTNDTYAGGDHKHSWIESTHHGPKTVNCPEEPWFD